MLPCKQEHNGLITRLSWQQRMARNARLASSSPLEVTLHGLPAAFAQSIGLDVVTAA